MDEVGTRLAQGSLQNEGGQRAMTIRNLIVLPLLLAACAVEDPSSGRSQVAVSMSTAEAAAVLALVNYPGTTAAVLDDQVGLDPRAAEATVAHRAGKDGLCPSADDQPFKDLTELDAMSWVGDAAFEKLRAYALAHPVPADEAVEGVLFKGWQSEAVVYGVNNAPFATLDMMLDVRAANGLYAARPFATVAQMGAVANVGPTALARLRLQAESWWNAKHQAPTAVTTITLDGVTFDEETARVALEIANLASNYDLVAHGVYTTGASRIVFARPFATLADVAAVQDVGTASMRALRDWAASGTWVSPAECSRAVTAGTDADVASLDRLLELATTGDWPYAELRSLQVSTCVEMADALEAQEVRNNVLAANVIDWGYPSQYVAAGGFVSGARTYLGLLASARDAIQEHVQSGQWTPETAEDRALLESLPRLYESLTATATSTPSRFYELPITLDMEECSQHASVLVDTVTGRITVIHRYPRC